MRGIELVRALGEGRAPLSPYLSSLGIRFVGVDSGAVRISVIPNEQQVNSGAVVHGGILSSYLDTALGLAVHTMLADGLRAARTVDLHVTFTSPVCPGERLIVTGTVNHIGSRIATAAGEIRGPGDRVCATAIATFMLPRDTQPTSSCKA